MAWAVNNKNRKWPVTTIAYKTASVFSKGEKDSIIWALRHIQEKVPPFQFWTYATYKKKYGEDPAEYLNFVRGVAWGAAAAWGMVRASAISTFRRTAPEAQSCMKFCMLWGFGTSINAMTETSI
ncbi:MAG: hypothetical protein AAF222_13360 [Pseudomonadota bacterium]